MPAQSRIGFPRDLGTRRPTEDDLEFVRGLKSLLSDARSVRQQTREELWRDSERRYMGRQPILNADDPTADAIVVNKTFSTVVTIAPFVSTGDIEFYVRPFSSDSDSSKARYISIWLNRLWRSVDFDGKNKFELSAWDSIVYGDGYLMPSYSIETKVRRGEDGEPIPLSDKEVAYFELHNVSPWDVWIDRYSNNLKDARWYIRRLVIPLSVVEDDPTLYYKDSIDLQEAYEDAAYAGDFFHHQMREGERDMVVLYEYYDRDLKRRVIFSEGSEFPHQWVESVDSNLIQVPNHRVPGIPYHMGDVEQMTQLQDELNKTRSQMITYRRRNQLKFFYDENAFDDEAIEAMKSSVIGIGIPVDASNMPVGDSFVAVTPQPIPEDAYNVATIISSDIDEITGVNEYLRGNLSEIRRTATEASIIEGSSNTKIRAKVERVERAARQVGQVILELAGEVMPTTDTRELELYLTGEEAMQVLAASGEDVYNEQGDPRDAILTPDPELFTGKYEVFVQSGSTELRSPVQNEQRQREIFMTLVNVAPILQQQGVVVSLRHALTKWLESAGITDINSYLNDPTAAAGVEQAMLQQQMLGQPPTGGAVGAPTQSGQPNPYAEGAPQDIVDFTNSGMQAPEESF